jgi:lipopolysaccharide transport system ATP-binding protein
MQTAIKVENLSKQYRLGNVGAGTLREDVKNWFDKLTGKYTIQNGEENDRTIASTSKYVWSLKDINFELKQGDALGVIGMNGAGKSTLLKVLSKITAPTTGTIKTKGRITSLLEVGTGFHPELTGKENIYLNGAILGMRKSEINRKLDEIIDFAGVERYINTPVKRYSSGMYVRLAFAVAAHLENDILILDEVLSVGDSEFQKKCLGKMDDAIKGQGKTVLFVSHNLASVQKLCNRGIILSKGNLTFDGSSGDAVNHYLMDAVEKSRPIVEFEDNVSQIQIKKLIISDANDVKTTLFKLGEVVQFQMEYIVREPLKGTNMCLVLKRNGLEVLCSFDCDEDDANLIKTKTGNFTYLINLPTEILKAGIYSLSVDVGMVGIGVIEKNEDIITFTIEETNEMSHTKGYAEQRVGFLYKKLNWKHI